MSSTLDREVDEFIADQNNWVASTHDPLQMEGKFKPETPAALVNGVVARLRGRGKQVQVLTSISATPIEHADPMTEALTQVQRGAKLDMDAIRRTAAERKADPDRRPTTVVEVHWEALDAARTEINLNH